MNAKAIFNNNSTDCTLAVPNSKGVTTYTVFERVSDMVNYCRENGIEAEPTVED